MDELGHMKIMQVELMGQWDIDMLITPRKRYNREILYRRVPIEIEDKNSNIIPTKY